MQWYHPKVGKNKNYVVHYIIKKSRNNHYIEAVYKAIYKVFGKE